MCELVNQGNLNLKGSFINGRGTVVCYCIIIVGVDNRGSNRRLQEDHYRIRLDGHGIGLGQLFCKRRPSDIQVIDFVTIENSMK